MDVQISGDTKEAVAMQLLELIARAENRVWNAQPQSGSVADRAWTLSTYLACFRAVQGLNPD